MSILYSLLYSYKYNDIYNNIHICIDVIIYFKYADKCIWKQLKQF